MEALTDQARWLAGDTQLFERSTKSDDEFDALVSALMARAADQRRVQRIADVRRAKLEGWIHLPRPDSLRRISV